MALSSSQPRAFVRAEGEEEITPPCSKTRSFDSLSVAHLLQAKLDPTAKESASKESAPVDALRGDSSPLGPGSPSIDDAAALLTNVQSHGGMDKAVDCLMSLAAFGGPAKPSGPSSSKKRVRHASLNPSLDEGEQSDGTSTRRRLAMRPPSKLRPPSKSPRPRSTSPQAHALMSASHAAETPTPAAPEVSLPAAAAAAPPCLSVTGIVQPVRLLSGANLQQLKLLSAAFKLCPTPTAEQLVAIAHRVSLSAEKLETWFESRRTLETWIEQQPHLQPADIAAMFFEGEDGQVPASTSTERC